MGFLNDFVEAITYGLVDDAFEDPKKVRTPVSIIGAADADVVAADLRLRRRLAGEKGSTLAGAGRSAARITMPTLIGTGA